MIDEEVAKMSTTTTGGVGIDQIGVYLPRFALSLSDLADARGIPREKISLGLGAHAMAVAPPWEDAVTLAANAAARLLAQDAFRPEEIGLLLVATETAVDHAKPASIFLHELLGLPASCRTFELKHACYGGTAGVMVAADWLRSGAARGRKALVVATDIARYGPGSSAEFTQGAGAVALLLSCEPRLLSLDPLTGVYARNVYDFWRPLDRREALVDGKFSLDCYLTALDGALDDYRAAMNGAHVTPLTDRFASLLYHTPFPKMAYKAHLRLFARDWRLAGGDEGSLAEAAERSFATQVEPALHAARLVGNTYTASLYICLAWLAERHGTELEGRELGMFSYGSGCCAEFFTGRLAPGGGEQARRIGIADQLAARRELSVEEYELLARPVGSRAPAAGESGPFWLSGIRDEKRIYAREACAG
jgi:hydroxymethylglutaryl-CoA synthase